MHVLYVDGVWKAEEEGKVPKKKVNQDLRLSNEKGDFIVISRTFFFYPNLVWILNFLFFKENFLITNSLLLILHLLSVAASD